jgi:hypothetical protein
MKHGGVWTAHPAGALRITVREADAVSAYAFGTRTAAFHVCARCGVVPVVTSLIEARLYAVVNVNAFDDVAPSLLRPSTASFDGEGEGPRLARRKRGWIADVAFSDPRMLRSPP